MPESVFACAYMLYFKDGGPPESGVLGTGSMEECQRLQDLVPAIGYSGDRQIDRAELVILGEYDA